MANLLVCPSCGRACKEDDCICPSCGHIFDENVEKLKDKVAIERTREIIKRNKEQEYKAEQEKTEEKKTKKQKKYFYIFLTGVILITLFLAWQFQLKNNYEQEVYTYNSRINDFDEMYSYISYIEDTLGTMIDFVEQDAKSLGDYTYPSSIAVSNAILLNNNLWNGVVEKSYNLSENNSYYGLVVDELNEIIESNLFKKFIMACSYQFIDDSGNVRLYSYGGAKVVIQNMYIDVYGEFHSIKDILNDNYPIEPVNNSIFK